MTRPIFALLALTLLCGCAQEDDRGEAGRTSSLATVGSGASARDLRLVIRRTRTPAGTESYVLIVTAPAGDLPSGVSLPGGEELEASSVDVGGASARFGLGSTPSEGIYRFRWSAEQGLVTSISVSGAPPPYPEFESPLDQGLYLPASEPVRWSWTGSAGLFDLELSDAQGSVLSVAKNLAGREADLLPRLRPVPGSWSFAPRAARARLRSGGRARRGS